MPEPRPPDDRVDQPDGNAQHRRPSYDQAGGEDSSPFENVPSGEAREAAEEPQNAEPAE